MCIRDRVYAEPITPEQLELLQQKITAICDWAYSFLQIKLSGHLLSEHNISNQIASSDLDRFYANGLVLAGLTPSWWAIPPANQTVLTAANHQDAIDFGALNSKKNNEQSLLDQSFEVINNAMDSNLESCLSLIFQKVQLEQYPDFLWLSDLLKQAVYSGITDPMLLDSNHLKLNYITTFCGDAETVFIAQQSFYVHSRERLSKTVNLALYPWRRTVIEAYYKIWNWPPNTVELLDKRDDSHYRQSLNEYQNVRLQITNTMQSAFLFAQQHKINIEITKQKLTKKFKILFENELDVINALPFSFKPKSAEQQLYLARTSLSDNWQINDLPATLSTEPLYQHPSLLNVLAWAVNNQLLTKASALQFVDQRQKVKIGLVLDLIQQLLQSPIKTSADKTVPLDFDKQAEINSVLLFANLEHQTTNVLTQQGLELTSLQTDPLNYANNKQSLVASIEGLIRSTWGQLHYVIYTGPTALLDFLSTIIQWQPKLPSALTTKCWCHSENHGQKISRRLETVYSDVITHYVKHASSGDYLIAVADRFYKLHWQQGLVDVLPLNNQQSLEQHLAAERDIFSASKLDPLLDKEGLFKLLLNQQLTNRISLFLLSKNNGITLYIVDDFGTLLKQPASDLTTATLVNQYQQFLNKMNINYDVTFFHLTHSTSTGWQISEIDEVNISLNRSTSLPVQVELDSAKENAHCAIHCGAKTFIGNINDPSLFKQVSDLLLNLRKTNSRYPLYINQLSFTSGQTYTTRHYIIVKQKIETLLNRAEILSL
ncbi:MAG TPA: hypothetical protein ENH74_03640 [Methylophaga sp.]|nr:hypothetical protein [Methylophaga sp.]